MAQRRARFAMLYRWNPVLANPLARTTQTDPLTLPTLQRLADIGYESIESTDVAGVEAKPGCLPSHRLGFADQTLRLGLIRVIGKDDIEAAPQIPPPRGPGVVDAGQCDHRC